MAEKQYFFAFDFHGVTLAPAPEGIDSELFAETVADRCRHKLEDIKNLLYGNGSPDGSGNVVEYVRFVRGEMSMEEFVGSVLMKLDGIENPDERQERDYLEKADELIDYYVSNIKVNHRVMEIIRILNEQGHHVGFLTNRTGLSMAVLEKIDGYYDLFPSGGISSHAVYCQKPDARIFYLFQELMSRKYKRDIQPDEIILVDDLKRNIDAAEKLGFHGLYFTSARQLAADLKEKFDVVTIQTGVE
jgi:FMN phosphatase YigB (HAD superfamily)